MPDIKLYQFIPVLGRESASPFSVKLHYAFRYKCVPFEVINIGNPSELKKYTNRGKLPVAAAEVRKLKRLLAHYERTLPRSPKQPVQKGSRGGKHALDAASGKRVSQTGRTLE
ncbi:MAG TPA: hypothetical protein VMA09_21470 [Candidatus Binataceae bacterium]|nr:hypothetical protein [Candidatus Binataceae bacterium]